MATMTAPSGDVDERVGESEDKLRYLQRWLRVWIALLVIATLTVVAFLVLIAMALHRVDANVALADRRVAAVRANVSVLPGLINTTNSHLAAINQNLEPIPDQVGLVNQSLGSVNGDLNATQGSLSSTAGILQHTDAALQSTSGRLVAVGRSLRATSGSLKDTHSLLVSVSGLAGRIDGVLENAESPRDRLGAKDIYQRVARANDPLRGIRGDSASILHHLDRTNRHLRSICTSPLLTLLGPAASEQCRQG